MPSPESRKNTGPNESSVENTARVQPSIVDHIKAPTLGLDIRVHAKALGGFLFDPILSPPILLSSGLFTVTKSARLYFFVKNGDKIAVHKLKTDFLTCCTEMNPLVASNGEIVVATIAGAKFVGFFNSNGEKIHTYKLSSSEGRVAGKPVILESGEVFVLTTKGKLLSFANNNQVIYKVERVKPNQIIRDIFRANNALIMINEDNSIQVFDSSTKETLSLPDFLPNAKMCSDVACFNSSEDIFIGTTTGLILLLNKKGEIRKQLSLSTKTAGSVVSEQKSGVKFIGKTPDSLLVQFNNEIVSIDFKSDPHNIKSIFKSNNTHDSVDATQIGNDLLALTCGRKIIIVDLEGSIKGQVDLGRGFHGKSSGFPLANRSDFVKRYLGLKSETKVTDFPELTKICILSNSKIALGTYDGQLLILELKEKPLRTI